MKMRKAVAVFGYNNTRIYDLIKIRKLARERLDAEILLIKEGITQADLDAVPYCLDHQPEDPASAPLLVNFLATHALEIVGCLALADKGVIGAAHAAKSFGLPGDDCESSFAMLDKKAFRQLEASLPIKEASYKKPFFLLAHSESEVREVLESKGTFFLKPVAEGNSRGCMKIESPADLERWLEENRPSLKTGVICEELLSESDEYSFDGVAGAYWITKKFTTSGSFRAEYQHVVPAPFAPEKTNSIHQVLEPLLRSLGSNGGAFHHEFFMLKDERLASVEPNRRPAGMWIWDLAAWAFEGFDPWTLWMDWCAGVRTESVNLKATNFAGVRAVISRHNGILSTVAKEKIEALLKGRFGEKNVRLSFLKAENSLVRAEPRDNSDFLGFIALKHRNYEVLLQNLEEANLIFLENTEVKSCV